MHPAEKHTDRVSRPKTRRKSSELNCCQDCKQSLTAENWSPSMRGETGQRPRHICKSCWSARQKRYAGNRTKDELNAMQRAARLKRKEQLSEEQKEQDRRRRYGNWLKRNYGITINEFEAIYDKQEGKCKICNTAQPRGRGGFHVDHCHQSGIVRGLLCAGCNMMLGLAKDSKETLINAIEYLAANDDHKPEARAAVGGKAY